MFVLLTCLGWAYCQRRGWLFLGGLLLAAAGAVKLAPFVLVPWLILRRDRCGLAGVWPWVRPSCFDPDHVAGSGRNSGTACRMGQAHHRHARADANLSTGQPVACWRALPDCRQSAIGHVCYSPDNLSRLIRVYPLLLAALVGWLYVLLRKRRFESTAIDNVSLATVAGVYDAGHPRAGAAISWRCFFRACYWQYGWCDGNRVGMLPWRDLQLCFWQPFGRRMASAKAGGRLALGCSSASTSGRGWQ